MLRRPALLLLVLAAAACGGRSEGPAPPPPAPDLAGARVMLLPVRAPAPEQLDAELAFWLRERSPSTDWVLPAELQAAADRTPAWRLRLDALPRPVREMGRGQRVLADPLYGAVRQLGALVHADHALVPVSVERHEDEAGVSLELSVAVVDIRGGRVLWMHTAAGERNPSDAEAVASVAEKVARSLVP